MLKTRGNTVFEHKNPGQQSETKRLTYSGESSVGFSRREEGSQHAAKLQLSARTESRTHFVHVS